MVAHQVQEPPGGQFGPGHQQGVGVAPRLGLFHK